MRGRTIRTDPDLSHPLPVTNVRLHAVPDRGGEGRRERRSKVYLSTLDSWLAHPVATSHILIVLSLDEETRKSPEGINETEETLWS